MWIDDDPPADDPPANAPPKDDPPADDPPKDDPPADDPPKDEKPYWPEDWRDTMAKQYAGDDEKAYKQELRRLERYTDPNAVYSARRDAEKSLSSGKMIAVPGKDATDAEKAAFHQALGVPEKPEGYLEGLELNNDVEIGEADMPMVQGFSEAMHAAGATQGQMKAALDWYYDGQEKAMAELDEADEKYADACRDELKRDFGNNFQREINAIAMLFPNDEVRETVYGARGADGRILGDNPAFIKALSAIAKDRGFNGSEVESTHNTVKSVDDRIAEINKYMKTNKAEYFKDEKMQQEYRDLLERKESLAARG